MRSTLEEGKAADLLVLSADPLTDIRNTWKIGGCDQARDHVPARPVAPVAKEPLNVAQAQALLAQAYKLFYNPASAAEFHKGRELLQRVEAGLTALIQRRPHTAEAFYLLGLVQLELAQYFEVQLEAWGIQPDEKAAARFLEASLQSAERAVELDNRHSDAHRLNAEAIMRLIRYKGFMFAVTRGPKAKKLLEQAIQLDATNPRAHLALGGYCFFTPERWADWPGSPNPWGPPPPAGKAGLGASYSREQKQRRQFRLYRFPPLTSARSSSTNRVL